ncbi:MAG: FAD-dependent oxidoreductase [Coriobacteriales bacterium]|jgi:thioredoxin reductase (NADPH)|nr:FAD-dependent oxidoreductase [Coriobacteriales bacterium]
MYDIAIIGAGPAGLSAAITARARDKDVCVISNRPQESPLAKSRLVDNYPGLPGVSGLGLLERFVEHARNLGAIFRFARVVNLLPLGSSFSVTTSDDSVEARAVILALGAARASTAFPGEQEYLGRGVSYCATCDGMLYRDSTVSVVDLAPDAADEANFLHGLGATVHFLTARADPKTLSALDKGIVLHEGKVVAVEGDGSLVTGLRIARRLEPKLNKDELVPCRGVFILRPSIAPTALLPTLETRDNYIATNAGMGTSVPGVFAAGDCVGPPLQVAKAAGEGQRAAFAAVDYLSAQA